MHMEIRNAHRSLVVSVKPEIKGSHERFSLIQQDNIETDTTKIGRENQLQSSGSEYHPCWAFVNTVTKFRFPWKAENFSQIW
jgi:hypothetical protein